MYVRSPGGILVECTANVPDGFFRDEAPDELGTKLPNCFYFARPLLPCAIIGIDQTSPALTSSLPPPPCAPRARMNSVFLSFPPNAQLMTARGVGMMPTADPSTTYFGRKKIPSPKSKLMDQSL